MNGRICLVTGGTGGIGLVTARELTRLGADVIVVGRDRPRGEAVAVDLGSLGGGTVTFIRADLSSQREIRSLAATVGDRFGRLDVLVNNAGAMFGKRTLSVDGIEMTFALNHLAYVLLSETLLPLLRTAGRARIVNVASEAHRNAALPFDNLQGERGYSGWRAYKRSKLANLMFTYELARRLDGRRDGGGDEGAVTVNALHPGFVATAIGARNKLVPNLLWRLASLVAIKPDEGAKTSIYLASSADVADAHGQYFIKCVPADSSPQSHDREAAERLWAVSEQLCGIRDAPP